MLVEFWGKYYQIKLYCEKVALRKVPKCGVDFSRTSDFQSALFASFHAGPARSVSRRPLARLRRLSPSSFSSRGARFLRQQTRKRERKAAPPAGRAPRALGVEGGRAVAVVDFLVLPRFELRTQQCTGWTLRLERVRGHFSSVNELIAVHVVTCLSASCACVTLGDATGLWVPS